MKNCRILITTSKAVLAVSALAVVASAQLPAPSEGDFTIPVFRCANGEELKPLRIHYRTLGTPQRDSTGLVRNAVLIMHGTGGSGAQFVNERFAGQLFGPGQPLDITRYYLILPDDIGHGGSSKPSNGLRMRFPHYSYRDMVEAEHRLVTEHLHINHLRLVMGTSMGAMHTWLWGETWPEFMDGLMPLASLPAPITGRNYLWRRMLKEAIQGDPEWRGGEYSRPPRGLRMAAYILLLMGSAPLDMQKSGSTREDAENDYEKRVTDYLKRPGLDANDLLYQVDSSRDYDPSKNLEKISAPLLAINSADDEINPPELGIMEKGIARVPHGRYVLLPATTQTRGHGTHTLAAVWKHYLEELLEPTRETLVSSGRR